MRKTAAALLLSLSLAAHAQPVAVGDTPASPSPDPVAELLASRGLVERLEGMRQQMSLAASDLVVTAMGFLGVPYRRGGNSPENGLDCSGLVRYVFKQSNGIDLPRTSVEMSRVGEQIDKKDLQPGDLVFFNTLRRTFSHVGIYLGDNKFIHAPTPGSAVRIESMDLNYWKARFNGTRRVLTSETNESSRR